MAETSISWNIEDNQVTQLTKAVGGDFPSGTLNSDNGAARCCISGDGDVVVLGRVGSGADDNNTTVVSKLLTSNGVAADLARTEIDAGDDGNGTTYGISHDGSKLVMFGDFNTLPAVEGETVNSLPVRLYNKQADGTFAQATGVFSYGDAPDGAGNTQRGYGAVLDVGTNIAVASKGGAGAGEDPVGFNVGTQVLNLASDSWNNADPEDGPQGGFYPGGDGFTTGTRPDGTEVGAGGGAFVRVTENDEFILYGIDNGDGTGGFDIVKVSLETAAPMQMVLKETFPTEVGGETVNSISPVAGSSDITHLDDDRLIVVKMVQTEDAEGSTTDHILVYVIDGSTATLNQTISLAAGSGGQSNNLRLVRTEGTVKDPAPDQGVILQFSTLNAEFAPEIKTFNLNLA